MFQMPFKLSIVALNDLQIAQSRTRSAAVRTTMDLLAVGTLTLATRLPEPIRTLKRGVSIPHQVLEDLRVFVVFLLETGIDSL